MMKSHASQHPDVPTLLPETVVQRKLPVNFHETDLELFRHELEKVIPQTRLLELNDVRLSSEGVMLKHLRIMPESFAFPETLGQWKIRSLLKFVANNYVIRRTRKVEREALWITDEWSHGYFHWLTDVLSRLFVMRERLHEFVLLLPASYELLDFVQASLNCFGVKNVEFIGRNEVLRCRRLFMPTHTAPSGHYNEELIRGVRALLLKDLGDPGFADQERVYISRGRAPKRKIVNEDRVRELLEQFGFKTIYAEDHSFAEQVRICSRARYLVSNHGAGLTNMLFMPEASSVLELRHHTDAINNCYFTLSSALNLNYFYQACQSGDARKDPHAADLVVDLNLLKTNLKLLTGS